MRKGILSASPENVNRKSAGRSRMPESCNFADLPRGHGRCFTSFRMSSLHQTFVFPTSRCAIALVFRLCEAHHSDAISCLSTGGTPNTASIRGNDIPVVGGWRAMDRNVHAPRMLVRPRFSVKLTALGGSPDPTVIRIRDAPHSVAWRDQKRVQAARTPPIDLIF